jgi:hypothetical protein
VLIYSLKKLFFLYLWSTPVLDKPDSYRTH